MAARLAHVLVANMDTTSNAVVASQATIGELMGGVHRNTVRKAIQVLEAERWIEVLQIGGKGGALAYVVNSRVAWGQSRRLSVTPHLLHACLYPARNRRKASMSARHCGKFLSCCAARDSYRAAPVASLQASQR